MLYERKCFYCNCLEDEYHFILECPLYTEIRSKYIKKYYWKKPCIPKFIELFQSNNVNIVRKLSMYIFECFKKRNDFVYD